MMYSRDFSFTVNGRWTYGTTFERRHKTIEASLNWIKTTNPKDFLLIKVFFRTPDKKKFLLGYWEVNRQPNWREMYKMVAKRWDIVKDYKPRCY